MKNCIDEERDPFTKMRIQVQMNEGKRVMVWFNYDLFLVGHIHSSKWPYVYFERVYIEHSGTNFFKPWAEANIDQIMLLTPANEIEQ